MNSIDEFREYINRLGNVKGITDLILYLKHSDYFSAPASTRFHSSYKGGLLRHSLNVTKNILYLTEKFGYEWDRPESPIIIGLFHDICKVAFYKESLRNVKDDVTGKWEKKPYYEVDDTEPLGHGEKSVIMLMKYIDLTDQEIFCIRYHMGAFGDKAEQYNYSNACQRHPEILIVAFSDQLAGIEEVYWDGGLLAYGTSKILGKGQEG